MSISATLQAQAAGHERAEAAHARAAARLGKAGGGGGGADGNDLLAALKEDVAKLRRQVRGCAGGSCTGAFLVEGGVHSRHPLGLPHANPLCPQVDEVQPREIEARQRRLTALQDALSIEVRPPRSVCPSWQAQSPARSL